MARLLWCFQIKILHQLQKIKCGANFSQKDFQNMSRKPLTDIFFDLDHTLWDFDRNSRSAFQRVFQNHQLPLELDAFLQRYEPINHRYWRLYREDTVTKEELRRGRLIETFDYFGMQFSLKEI